MAVFLQTAGSVFYSVWENERQKMLGGGAVVCLLTISPGRTSMAFWPRCPVNICLLVESLSFPGKLETQD